MESRPIPIVPFSPICLIDPTLPQCTDYIFGVGPANCSGVSNECENELFRLNKSLSLDLNFVSFIANNLPCDEDAIQPCWEGNNKSSPPVGVNTGRFKQGSCTIDCKQNISRLEQICKNQTGFLCDSEYNVGLDGTELKVILPVCLPEVCRKTTNGHIYQNDLRAIEYCMNQHTCGSLSPKSRALIPECTVTLPGCLEPSDIFHFIVLYFLSFLSILIIFLGCFKFVRGRISRNNKNISTSKAKYYVTSTATATATATKSFSTEGKVDSLNTPLMANEGSKYVLSDDLANQQQHGRFALGDRRDSRASTSIHDYQIGSSLTYRNLFFRYLGRRLILRGVSGILKRGSCVAVIGAPDSGTTTLLRCLAGRQPKGKVEGSLLIDGKLPDRKITRIIAYIPKEDICHGSLTVRETLDFSARCRLPRTVSTEERNSRCDAWLELLGLTHVSNSIVGDANIRGISGGERRRVSIGISTVAGHRLVIADSPTNGLDSDAAFNVIKTMRALADAHHNGFMVSVRQPSERLLKLFDTICLMSKGKCIFWGRLHEAVPFMEKVHLTKPLRKSLPDFLEELTGKPSKFLDFSNQENQEELGSRSTNRNSKVTAEIIHRKYVESELYERMGKEMWNAVDDSTSLLNFADDLEPASCCPSVLIDDDGKFFFNTEKYSTGCGFQVAAVCGRQIKLISRSPTVRARISRAIFQGFLLGTMFYHFDQSQSAANNRFGALFISLSAIVMGSVSTIPELSSQRRVFYLEKRSGYFRPLVWQLSLILSEIPIALVEMAAYSTLLYGLCDLREGILSLPFLYFYLSLVITSLICWSVAAIAVMASESVVAAQALVPVYNAANLLFSGYLLSKAQIPSYLQWLTVTSTVTRPFVGIAINEMKEQIFHCEDNERIPFKNDPKLFVPAPLGFNNEHYRACPLQTGDDALKYLYGINPLEHNIWILLIQSLIFFLGFQCLLALSILFVDHSKTQSDDPLVLMSRQMGKKTETEQNSLSQSNVKEGNVCMNNVVDDFVDSKNVEIGDDTFSGNGTELRFDSIYYSVTLSNGQQKCILSNISGRAKPGSLVALMGPSGAGKTTLLDVISGRKTGGQVKGLITLNGRPKDNTFPRYAGYCEQMDSHLPTLTVKEALMISASLRYDASDAERKRSVNKVLKQLHLENIQNQLIGTPGLDGIAPEARKLTTIGVELVCCPKVLFLDEPTTGLDSSSALATMQLAKSVAKVNGIAVLCTIHQPASEIFELFDTLLLLQKGGRPAYFGLTSLMNNYFVNQCGANPMEEGTNPADYSLTCASLTNFHVGQVKYSTAADAFESFKFTNIDSTEEKENALNQDNIHDIDDEIYDSPFATSEFQQFSILLKVYFLLHWRDKKVLYTRMSLAVVFGLMVGILFFGVELDQVGAKARVSIIFISLVYAGNVATMAIPTAVMIRPVIFRERGSNAYRLCPFYWATLIAEIPFVVVQGLLYSSTMYFIVGFQAEHFMRFLGGFTLLSMLCFSFAHFMASISPNADVGTILSATCQSVFTLFCGFLLPYENIPFYWRGLYYLSMFRYPLNFFTSNELVGLKFDCPNGDSTVGKGLPVGGFPVFVGGLSSNTSYPPPPRGNGPFARECLPIVGNFTNLYDHRCWRFFCPIQTGEFILERYSMPTSMEGMYVQLAYMLIYFIGLRIITFISLGTIQHIKR